MPGGAVVHAAVFTAGALLGGGIAAVVANRRKEGLPPPAPSTPAIVQVDRAGRAQFSESVRDVAVSLPPALKNGHPGKLLQTSI
jgi:endonuclease G